jgi:hypothetical protein
MVARIDNDSFYARREGRDREERRERRAEIPRRRDRRNKAEMEIELVERALARAIEETREIERALPGLELHRSREQPRAGAAASEREAARPSCERARHILDQLERSGARSEQVLRGMRESDREPAVETSGRAWEHTDKAPVIAALQACFGPQAMAHLDDIATLYRVAGDLLDNRETMISRRFGDAPPDVADGLWALAEARGASDGVSPTGGYPIDIYDPFFRNVDSYRWTLLGFTPAPLDLDLRNAGILVHEALHWHVGGGHQELGDRRNPQNYEFYVVLRHSSGPPTYTKLGEFRRD